MTCARAIFSHYVASHRSVMRIFFLLCLPLAAAVTLLEGSCDVAHARVLTTNGPSGPIQFVLCDLERIRSYRLMGLVCDRAFPVLGHLFRVGSHFLVCVLISSRLLLFTYTCDTSPSSVSLLRTKGVQWQPYRIITRPMIPYSHLVDTSSQLSLLRSKIAIDSRNSPAILAQSNDLI